MKGLILHVNAQHVSRDQLAAVPVPMHTRTYQPVSHAQFVDVIEDKLAALGYRFGDQAYGLTHDGSRFFGVAQLQGGILTDGYSLTVGMRASLDKSMAPRVAFGSHVFVCDNLAFTGEIVFTRKQTTFIARDLPLMAADACSRVSIMSERQELRFQRYKAAAISDRDADHAIVQMLRAGVVNTQRVEKVVAEWDNPTRDHGGRAVWRLFNAVTQVLKDAPMAELPTRTIALQGVCDTFADFAPVVDAEVIAA